MNKRHPSSFRDPAGHVVEGTNEIYRVVADHWRKHLALLQSSGLYETLTQRQWLIPHTTESSGDQLVIKPDFIPQINYPYEWSFGMLKDAALLTLRICRDCIRYGMILKDASAFNIVFRDGRPVFIDTLSFETYDSSRPWVAYQQYCQQFLYPLLLARYGFDGLQSQLLVNLEGMSAGETAKRLPLRARFSAVAWLHVFLPANMQQKHADRIVVFSQQKMEQLLDHLLAATKKIQRPVGHSTWSDYYAETILGKDYLAEKENSFLQLLAEMENGEALDLGANDGHFSKLLADRGWIVTAIDADENAIERLYLQKTARIQPLWINLAQASPAIGWMNQERKAFWERYAAHLVLALALIHHLYFRYQLPFDQQAEGFARLSRQWLLVEFVHPDDPKIEQLVAGRKNLLEGYTEAHFTEAFSRFFDMDKAVSLKTAARTLYLLKRKSID